MKYASQTTVSAERSKAEIERLLSKYGAEQFVSGWDASCAKVGFRMRNKMIRFTLPLPDKQDEQFCKTPAGRRRRHPEDAWKAWEQATRQRWRALALVVKAKLEAVDGGVTDFESEFLPYIVLPDGKTVSEHVIPAIDRCYQGGKVTALLPGW